MILTKEQAEKLAGKFVFEFSHDVDENHVCAFLHKLEVRQRKI